MLRYGFPPNSSHRLHCPTIKGLCQHCWSRHRKQWSHLPVMVSLQHGKRISSSNRGEWYVCRVHCLSSSTQNARASNSMSERKQNFKHNLSTPDKFKKEFAHRTWADIDTRPTATPFYSLLLNSLLLYFLLLYLLHATLSATSTQLYYTLLYCLKVRTPLRKLPNCCLRPEVPYGIRLHVLRASDFLWTAYTSRRMTPVATKLIERTRALVSKQWRLWNVNVKSKWPEVSNSFQPEEVGH